MMFDQMRLYDAGRFHDTELPDWYREAQRLSQAERIDWHCALERVLDCEYTLLTEDCTASAGLEIRFWPSEMNGILVLIEDPLGLVEQVVILNPTDWLPFLSKYLAPLIATSTQSAVWMTSRGSSSSSSSSFSSSGPPALRAGSAPSGGGGSSAPTGSNGSTGGS